MSRNNDSHQESRLLEQAVHLQERIAMYMQPSRRPWAVAAGLESMQDAEPEPALACLDKSASQQSRLTPARARQKIERKKKEAC